MEVPRGVVKGLWSADSLKKGLLDNFQTRAIKKGSKLLLLVQSEWNFVVALYGMIANFCWDRWEVPRGMVKGLWGGGSLEKWPFGQFSKKAKRVKKGQNCYFLSDWNGTFSKM